MYDSSKLVELGHFARVHAGSIVLDVWPGAGDWTRMFSDIAGPAGRVYSFVPAELAHCGLYIIIDHVAATGTGASRTESQHRIDPATVRAEVETAGFVLDAESTLLSNKDDPHSTNVFDPSIKGQTDRFAYRFVRL